jgi:uncharacterized protein YciI
MTHFVLTCLDKKNGLENRMAHRAAHLEYAGSFPQIMRMGGPLLDDDGQMIGSLIILECDKAQAEAFAQNDPYYIGGVFESVDIRGFKAVRGEFK